MRFHIVLSSLYMLILILISINWHICSWYDTKYIKTFATGVVGGTSWSGKLVGISEYDIAPQNSAISLKLETGRQNDWFIGFNRATRANSDVQEAPRKSALVCLCVNVEVSMRWDFFSLFYRIPGGILHSSLLDLPYLLT